MTRFALISIALLFGSPVAAQEQPAPPEASAEQPPAKLQSLLQNCDAHKFETTVESVVDGKPHRSNLKLCGTDGQSDADWIGTLKDAVEKVQANDKMPQATRDQVITAINSEITRLEAELAKQAPVLPQARQMTSSEPLSNDYTLLPPLPAPSTATPKVAAPSAGSPVCGFLLLPNGASGSVLMSVGACDTILACRTASGTTAELVTAAINLKDATGTALYTRQAPATRCNGRIVTSS